MRQTAIINRLICAASLPHFPAIARGNQDAVGADIGRASRGIGEHAGGDTAAQAADFRRGLALLA